MGLRDLEKRVGEIERKIECRKPQEPVECILVDMENFTEKEKEIQRINAEGKEVIVIHVIDGTGKKQYSPEYAEYLERNVQ